MKLIKGSDLVALGESLAELKRLSEGPIHRVTVHSETIFGAIRMPPGTYEVRRVEPLPEDEQF